MEVFAPSRAELTLSLASDKIRALPEAVHAQVPCPCCAVGDEGIHARKGWTLRSRIESHYSLLASPDTDSGVRSLHDGMCSFVGSPLSIVGPAHI